MKNNKVSLLLIGLFVVVIMGLGVFSYSLSSKLQIASENIEVEKSNYPEIYDVLNSMTVDTFKQKVADGETFNIYVGRPTCSDCTTFEPEFLEMLKEMRLERDVYYLNVAQLRKDEAEWENFKAKYDINYTPTLAVFNDGELSDIVNWTPENGTDKAEFEECLTKIAFQ